MIKIKLLLLLSLFFAIPGLSNSAVNTRTLEVEFAFTPPEDPAKQLIGYKFYKGSELVCETNDIATTLLTCDFITEDGTFDFSLTAYYADGTDSPPSPAFQYIIATVVDPVIDPPTDPPAILPAGSRIITYSWDQNLSIGEVTGYKMYMNDTLLCETNDSIAMILSCTADLINEPMAFTVTSFDINNIESPRSNILMLDPDDFSELFINPAITFNWEYVDSTTNTAGFRIYHNSDLINETTEPTARTATFVAELPGTIHTFTITAVSAGGIETTISNAITYNETIVGDTPSVNPPDLAPLAALIIATPTSGDAPLDVSFVGTNSTGDIRNYLWEFGDGTSATGSTPTHIYTIPGTYSASLTVEDNSGATHQSSVTINTASVVSAPPAPPTAVLSSTAAVGSSPLSVTFDGTASSTPNTPIVSYSWTFGDGMQGNGETTSHTYTTAGTYYPELTVTDQLGLTDSADTPVIVTTSSTPNVKPIAIITTTTIGGTAPLTVSFDGAQSSDSDGSISFYNWNFGDGSTATGSTAQHTFTSNAIYTVLLQVTDNQGESTTTTKQINVSPEATDTPFNFEVGEVSIDHEWVKVLFDSSFNQPVIIAGLPTTVNEADPVLVRVRNIDSESFEMRLQEWDYQDGDHQSETVNYIVLEQGSYSLDSGTKIEAGTFTSSSSFQQVALQQTYNLAPVILAQVITENKTEAVTGRIKSISQNSFEYKLQEQETTKTLPGTETVGYIAWEISKDDTSGLLVEAGITSQSVKQEWFDLTFQTTFPNRPLFIAGMQTSADDDTATVRSKNLSLTSVQSRVEEEQSNDAEVDHAAEIVGYLVIGSKSASAEQPAPSLDKKFTFTWDYGGTQDISGFKFYMNDSQLCETTNPNEREIRCYAALLNDTMVFSMTTLFLDGSESAPSGILSISPADHPDLFGIRLASFTWEYPQSQESQISGFRVFNNNKLVCESTIPEDRNLTCDLQFNTAENNFTIKAVELSGTESYPSNTLVHTK